MERQLIMHPPISDRFRGFLPVVIDVETGGFNAATDALLEMAAVTLAMDEDGILMPSEIIYHAVIPFEGANVEQAALNFTGIDINDPYRMALEENEALRALFQPIRNAVKDAHCSRAVMVAHNAHFDLGFVNAAVERNGIKRNPFHPFSCFDTATLAGLAYGQTVLARACEAEKTAELFCGIVNRWKDLGGWHK